MTCAICEDYTRCIIAASARYDMAAICRGIINDELILKQIIL